MHDMALDPGIEQTLASDVDGTEAARIRDRLLRDREVRLAKSGGVRAETTVRAYDAALVLLTRLRQQIVRRD